MTDADTKTNDQIIERPAKAWRAWFKALEGKRGRTRTVRPGDLYESSRAYPSEDVAETAALLAMAEIRAKYGRDTAVYLGTFPEGTRP